VGRCVPEVLDGRDVILLSFEYLGRVIWGILVVVRRRVFQVSSWLERAEYCYV
jgi:hypothetical protein